VRIGGVGEKMIGRTLIIQMPNENGDVIIGIPARVSTRTGTKWKNPLDFAWQHLVNLIFESAQMRNSLA
jgi:hypothetical protein